MKASNQDILNEFEDYQTVDYRDNFSIGEIIETFVDADLASGANKGFKIIKKLGYWESDRGHAKYESVLEFAKLLKEHGNLEHAKKEAGIGHYLARKYMLLMNGECEARGLPLVFKRAKRNIHAQKLDAKQVAYIKYLINKYSTYQVASMYSVAQQTILLIKKGMTWKDIEPIIKTGITITHVNQFLSHISIKKAPPPLFNPPTHSDLIKRILTNRWGLGIIKCPYCKHDKQYYNELEQRYKCANSECYRKYRPTTNTLYEGTNLTLDKWFIIESEISKESPTSGLQLAEWLHISQKTISAIINKIKHYPYKSLILTDLDTPINI